MDSRGKKLLIIAATIIVIFLGITAYFIFFNKKGVGDTTTGVDPNLFPFGQQSNQIKDLPVVENGETVVNLGGFDNTEQTPEPAPRDRLRKITTFPVSGFVSFLTPDTITETVLDEKTKTEKQVTRPITVHRIRYNDQRSGHIFEGIISDESIINRKITKTDLPVAEELVFNSTGTKGILRYEKDNTIESFQIELPVFTKELPVYCNINLNTDLKSGIKNKPEVKKLQQYLRDKLSIKISIDGVYGKQAISGVKQIQKGFAITETGEFNTETRTAILNDCNTTKQQLTKNQEEPYELKGSIIDGYIIQAIKNGLENSVFLLRTADKKTTGILKSLDSTAATSIFSSSFNEWLPQYVNKDLITMTTYASGNADGYTYFLNPVTKKFFKVLGPLRGLTTLTSPDGKYILESKVQNGQLTSVLLTLSTRSETVLPFTTLTEKCVWYSNDQFFCGVPNEFPAGMYPDDWYKGLVSFSDTLWSYTPSTNRAVSVVTPNESVDIFRMESYNNSEYLFFMNKNDYTLWSYRIGGQD
jgi:hypothetical protein